jgi:hypothetical protein
MRLWLYTLLLSIASFSRLVAAPAEGMEHVAQNLAELVTYRMDDLCDLGEPCDRNGILPIGNDSERIFVKRRKQGGAIEILDLIPTNRGIMRAMNVTISADGSVKPETGTVWSDVVSTLIMANSILEALQINENERRERQQKVKLKNQA